MKKSAPTPVREEWSPRKWIIPFGLWSIFDRYQMRCNLINDKFEHGNSQPLLIHGETGVGKSLFAEYFCYNFLKKFPGRPVMRINCAAIPSELLESELFGYVAGSHSTATKDKIGYFEIADDGVIILEEVGEMSKFLQAKLLIAIENRQFSKIGDTQVIPFKAQIVATSNVKRKKFRDDFFYRFDMFTVPPIRARRSDILHYIELFDAELINVLTRGAVLALLAYNWPGNVREIQRVCNYLRENIEMERDYSRRLLQIDPTMFSSVVERNRKNIYEMASDVTGFSLEKLKTLRVNLDDAHIEIDKIELILESHGLSLETYGHRYINQNEDLDILREDFGGYDCFVKKSNALYELSYFGFLGFCKLFFQNAEADYDILDLKEVSAYPDGRHSLKNCGGPVVGRFDFDFEFGIPFDRNKAPKEDRKFITEIFTSCSNTVYISSVSDVADWLDEYKEAFCEVLKYYTGIQYIVVSDVNNLEKFFENNMENKFISKHIYHGTYDESRAFVALDEVCLDDLREPYYETICSIIGTEHGFKKKLAEIAGRSPGRISQEFESLGLNQKFSQLNYKPRKRIVVLK